MYSCRHSLRCYVTFYKMIAHISSATGICASTMWYFRSMDAMGIYVITTRIMILLYFTTTKNQVLLMQLISTMYKDSRMQIGVFGWLIHRLLFSVYRVLVKYCRCDISLCQLVVVAFFDYSWMAIRMFWLYIPNESPKLLLIKQTL